MREANERRPVFATLLALVSHALRGRRHRRKLVFAATVFFHLFFIPYFDHMPLTRANTGTPNELVRVWGVRAMAEGHLYVNDVMADWPSHCGDCAARPSEPRDGPGAPETLFYPGKSPGSMFVALPFYYVYAQVKALAGGRVSRFEATYVCRLSGTILPSILLSWCIYLLLGGLSRRRHLVDSTYLVYLLGTITYPNALLFVSHQLASASLFVAFGILVGRFGQGWRRHAYFLAAGVMVGLAASVEFSALVPAAALIAYALATGTDVRREAGVAGFLGARRHLPSACAGFALPAALTLWYHAVAFGSPLRTAYDHLAAPEFAANMARGWHGFDAPRWEAFAGSFLGSNNGLFFYSPFLLLAFPGACAAFWRRRWRGETVVVLSILVGFALYISCLNLWRGGWSVGPRYVSNVVPFMVALALVGLDVLADLSPTAARIALGAFGVTSISIVAPAANVFPHLPDFVRSPYHEILVPMLRAGYVTENVLGLPGPVAHALFTAVLLATVGYVLLGDREARASGRLTTALASLALVATFHWTVVMAVGIAPDGPRWVAETAPRVFLLPPVF